MRQPELGKKIAELRKAKGMTQENLVEKCNLSVRTIQRIESGEVMPRPYTIKIIMAALEYDVDNVWQNDNPFLSLVKLVREFFLLDIDTEKSSDWLIKQLNISWMFGVLTFIVGFFEAAAEQFRFQGNQMIFGIWGYYLIKIVSIISFVYFQRGFILIGTIYKNYLLRILSFILIFSSIIVIIYDLASVFSYSFERQFILGAEALAFGGIGILYGISLFKLPQPIRRVASLAGAFEIIAGIFLITVVLAFVGLIVMIPAEILEIILLFKVVEVIKEKMTEGDELSKEHLI